MRKREREREIETEKESEQAKPPGTSAPTQAWARQASRHLEHAAAGEEKETEAENDIEKEKETETEEERGRDEAADEPRFDKSSVKNHHHTHTPTHPYVIYMILLRRDNFPDQIFIIPR